MLSDYCTFADTALASGSATAAIAVAAQTGRRHYVTGIDFSVLRAKPTATLGDKAVAVLQEGSTTIQQWRVLHDRSLAFDPPIRSAQNVIMNAKIDLAGQSGTATDVVMVNMRGYTQ